MKIRNWRTGLAIAIASMAVAGCGPESEDSGTKTPAPAEEPLNHAPTISGSPVLSALTGVAWEFQPSAADADGDSLTFSATGLPDWASIQPHSGFISGTPSLADAGTTAAIVVTVSDGETSASLPPFSITVVSSLTPPPDTSAPPPSRPPQQPNTAPTISGAPAAMVQATLAYIFTPSASDAENPQNLTFSITNKPAWAAFSTTTGTLSGTPSASQIGTYGNIRISVSDGSLTASLPAFSITVTAPPNRPPLISGSPSTSVAVGTAYSFRPTASDPDGQRLTFSITNKPSWASFSATTGMLSGTPSSAHVGTTRNIVIAVSDGTQSSALDPFSITVNAGANRPPTISGTPGTTTTVGSNYRFLPTASDPDNDNLTWSISGKPIDATFNTTTGELSWTPLTPGSWPNIVITVTDPSGAEASLQAFSITVAPTPQLGTTQLNWAPPTEYTDGTSLPSGQIGAYRIYHGTSATNLERLAEVDRNTTSFTVTELTAGVHYFAVTAVTITGAESAYSQVGNKTIN